MTTRVLRVAAAGVVLALAACAAPEATVSPTPDSSLAARPEGTVDGGSSSDTATGPRSSPAPTASSGASAAAADGPSATATSTAPSASPSAAASPSASASPSSAPFVTRSTLPDRVGDAGLEGPDWADLAELRIDDDGTTLRIDVTLADVVPLVFAEDEVVGIGIDLLREDDGESRYQVFLDGGSDGWFAYFQRPDGFVAFPGTFAIADRTLEVTLDAAAIGNPVRVEWRAFLEWSGPSLVVRRVANDRAPEDGWARFER